jgi:hypothetical protein
MALKVNENGVLIVPKGYEMEAAEFANNQEIRKVYFEELNPNIADDAFKNCKRLEDVYVGQNPNGFEPHDKWEVHGCTIGNGAFAGCHALKNAAIAENCESIGDHAFEGCYKIKSIYVPDSVSSIGNEAFKDCKSLETMLIPGTKMTQDSLGMDTFSGCEELKNVTTRSKDMIAALYTELYFSDVKIAMDQTTKLSDLIKSGDAIVVGGTLAAMNDKVSGRLELDVDVKNINPECLTNVSTVVGPESARSVVEAVQKVDRNILFEKDENLANVAKELDKVAEKGGIEL